MKHLILALACLPCCGLVWGQDALPAQLVLGGTANFSRYNYTYPDTASAGDFRPITTSTIRLSPYLGIRLGEHWMLGPQFGVSTTKVKQYFGSLGKNVTNKLTSFQLGLFARRYLGQPKPLQFFVEPSLVFTRQKNESGNEQIMFGFFEDYQDVNLQIAPGLTWAITPRINLLGRFGRLGFLKGKRRYYSETVDTKFSYFDIQLNPATFYLGIEYRFSKKPGG